LGAAFLFHLAPADRQRQRPGRVLPQFLTVLFLLGIAIAREFIGQFKHVESSWLTSSRGWGLYHV